MLANFFLHFAFAQMFLCTLILLKHCRGNLSISLFILLMVSGCGYLLGDISGDYIRPSASASALSWLGFIGSNALPGVFWLVSLSVFGDKNTIKRWQFILAASTLVLPLTVKLSELLVNYQLENFVIWAQIYSYSQHILELSLITHALYVALCNWRDDLIQERRYIRGGVISVTAIYILLVIVVEQLLKVDWQAIAIVKMLLLAGLTTGINFFLFDGKLSVLFVTSKPVDKTELPVKAPSKELQKVLDAMEIDKLYQQEGITIASFAKHLAIHEYKLRHLINGELNYRNFNDFLNFYRIKEVTEKLDQDVNQLPVLTLALDSGFRSLSSFNKAFKSTHGITPTEYRKKLVNS